MACLKNYSWILVIAGLFVVLSSSASLHYPYHERMSLDDENVSAQEDSLLPVIAWFSQRDTMTYWIYTWRFGKGDAYCYRFNEERIQYGIYISGVRHKQGS